MRREPLFQKKLVLIALLVGFTISACETTKDGEVVIESPFGEGTNFNPFAGGEYNPFWDQGDHLKKLIAEKKYNDAASLFEGQRKFFEEDKEKYFADLKVVADALNADKGAKIDRALASLRSVEWPTAVTDWAEISEKLKITKATLEDYNSESLMADQRFRLSQVNELEVKRGSLKSEIEATAPDEFSQFDHFGDQDFFKAYPINLDKQSFLANNFKSLSGKLEKADVSQIKTFAEYYPKDVLVTDHWHTLGNLYVAAALKLRGSKARELKPILTAIREAKNEGFEPKSVPGFQIGFVEVTSKTLLKQGQVEFPAEVKVDMPVETVKADLDDALTNATAAKADFVVIFDVALAKANRRITTKQRLPSKFIAAYRTQPNPDYNMAQNLVNQTQIEVQGAAMNSASVNSQYCQGWGCLGKAVSQIAAGARQGAARKKLQEAMSQLQSTPMTTEVPVYQNYNYDKAAVKATKLMTVHYYVINRRKKEFFKSTFDVEEKKTFDVVYSVHDKDPEKDSHLSNVDTDETVATWEEAAVEVRLSQLVDHYLKNRKRAKPLKSVAALRREMLRDKNTALTKYASKKFDARPLNDPRFDSVVVVYPTNKGRRALGSGFFVLPDVVLTNWHVVQDAKFVELKSYDGQETFGKIFASDLIRDLALVRVQSRGKPVRFYKKRSLDLGSTVEAIGHPKGLEFSITRGVISALRHQRTLNLERGGGKEILFIQTDAPVNKGNSGGPLFLGDRVIGVNTQVIKKSISEGLNFAVHFSEVMEFLQENLSQFRRPES